MDSSDLNLVKTELRTLVLVVIHLAFGGVVVLSKTPALCRVGLIWNVPVRLLDRNLPGLCGFLDVSQRLEHGEVLSARF